MHGVQRVPALLYNDPMATLESINCSNYDIFGFEPLHDIGKHIENALTELPANIPQQEAFELNTIIELPIGGRETKRTVDYRCTLVLAASQVRGKINSNVQLLLATLAKIQEIAYGSCWKR